MKRVFQNNLDLFFEYSELWHLTLITKIMIFGTQQDKYFDFNLGGNKIDISSDLKYIGAILAEIGTSVKQGNIILSKPGKQCICYYN